VLSGSTPMALIDIDSSAVSADQTRELRIILTLGGMIRMCDPDPKIPDTDTRKCPP
jgi:hypothetical protein